MAQRRRAAGGSTARRRGSRRTAWGGRRGNLPVPSVPPPPARNRRATRHGRCGRGRAPRRVGGRHAGTRCAGGADGPPDVERPAATAARRRRCAWTTPVLGRPPRSCRPPATVMPSTDGRGAGASASRQRQRRGGGGGGGAPKQAPPPLSAADGRRLHACRTRRQLAASVESGCTRPFSVFNGKSILAGTSRYFLDRSNGATVLLLGSPGHHQASLIGCPAHVSGSALLLWKLHWATDLPVMGGRRKFSIGLPAACQPHAGTRSRAVVDGPAALRKHRDEQGDPEDTPLCSRRRFNGVWGGFGGCPNRILVRSSAVGAVADSFLSQLHPPPCSLHRPTARLSGAGRRGCVWSAPAPQRRSGRSRGRDWQLIFRKLCCRHVCTPLPRAVRPTSPLPEQAQRSYVRSSPVLPSKVIDLPTLVAIVRDGCYAVVLAATSAVVAPDPFPTPLSHLHCHPWFSL